MLQVLELDELPSVVTLIGGGYIGMEFAGMFARLGCEVHVVARQAMPLAPRFDEEVSAEASSLWPASIPQPEAFNELIPIYVSHSSDHMHATCRLADS